MQEQEKHKKSLNIKFYFAKIFYIHRYFIFLFHIHVHHNAST